MNLEKLQYPIGKYNCPDVITEKVLLEWIDDISSFPTRIRNAVNNLTDDQLDTPYREGGWSLF